MDPMSRIPTFVNDDVLVGQVGDGSHLSLKKFCMSAPQASWWAQGMPQTDLKTGWGCFVANGIVFRVPRLV